MRETLGHAVVFAMLLCAPGLAGEKVLVALTNVPKAELQEAGRRTFAHLAQGYGIRYRRYDCKDYRDGFRADLARARLLSVRSRYEWRSMLGDPGVVEAFKSFMARGGIMLMQYKTIPGYHVPEFRDQFYKPLGFVPPTQVLARTQQTTAAPSTQGEAIMTTPNDLLALDKLESRRHYRPAYGHYTDLKPGQKPLFCVGADMSKPVVLIQRGICGKGLVVYVLLYRPAELYAEFMENLLTMAYGPLAKGAAVSLDDGASSAEPSGSVTRRGTDPATKLSVSKQNPLFLHDLVRTHWQCPQWDYRLPLVVFNPLDDCRRRTVAVVRSFPTSVRPASFRAVTPGGAALPCQARALAENGNTIEIVFQDTFLPVQNKCYFLYYHDGDVPEADHDTQLSIRKTDDMFELRNSQLKARFYANYPFINFLAVPGDVYGNRFEDMGGLAGAGYGSRNYATMPEDVHAEVLADGPVRKVLRYRARYGEVPFTIEYALDAGASRVSYVYSGKGRLTRDGRWSPGRGFDLNVSDQLFFCAKDGIKRFKTTMASKLGSIEGREMGEGWYAFQDTETGRTVGEIMDPDRLGRISFSYYTSHGLVYTSTVDAESFHGAFVVADAKGVAGVRDEYLDFKHPPVVLAGPEQTRGSVPARPSVPAIGKDQIRSIYYPVRRKHAMYWAYYDPVRLAKEQIPMLLDWGINSFFTTISAPAWKETAFKKDFPGEFDYLPRLVEMCHANGMLAGGSVVQMEKHSWYPDEVAAKLQKIGRCVDPLEALELQKQVTREIAATGADYVMLQDERAYSIHHGSKGTSRVAAQLYREKYGEDPAVLGREPEKYRQPSWHNTVFFQMDIWTRIMKELTQAGRQVNPEGLFFQVTSPSNMSRIWDGAPQDWERMAGHTEFSMDLYGKPKKLYKFYGKFMNAGNDNRRPHTIVSGCIMSAEELIANVAYNSMWWVSMNHMFPPRGYTYRNWLEEMQRLFQFYEHTGLGDLTLMPPVRRVAVLWDRAAMIDCIKHGEWTRTGSLSTVNVQNYVYINGLDLDIVMSKYFNRENLASYRFAIVPDERVLSDKLAAELKAFVEAGGTALVEGQCINNPVVRKLCGVEPLADEPATLALTEGPFPYTGPGVKVRNVSARVFVDFGGCAVYSRKVGEGTALYAPMVLNRAMHTFEASTWLRQTIDRFAGKPLIQFRPTDYEALESSVASDGRKVLLTVYNQAYGDQEFSFTWNGPAKPAGIVDFSQGEIRRLDGPYVDTIKGGQVKYYCIMRDREAYTIPAFEELPQGRDIAYSAAPGERVIEIRPADPQKKAIAGRRDRRPGVTYVGILSDAGREAEAYHSRITGDEAIKAALAGWRSLEVELMDDLSRAGLTNYDVVIVPNYNQHALTRTLKTQGGWERRLRDYVQSGGAVMLLHRSVGYSCKEPPFPEIGVNAFQKVTDLRQFRITADHPVVNASSVFTRLPDDAKNPAYQAQMDALKMAVGRSFTGSFVDHIALKKGPAGQVVAVSEVNDAGLGGQPAIICGRFGKGKVVLCGVAIGDSIIESEGQRTRREKVSRGEDSILINTVYWLGEK